MRPPLQIQPPGTPDLPPVQGFDLYSDNGVILLERDEGGLTRANLLHVFQDYIKPRFLAVLWKIEGFPQTGEFRERGSA